MAQARSKQPHIFLSCGEASGDRYGAALLNALCEMRCDVRVSALGGPALAAAGAQMVASNHDISVMGFGEALTHLRPILAVRRQVLRHLRHGDIDLFVPIDFPGFNLNLAKHSRRCRVPVFYIVPPQLWAWGKWRLRAVRRDVDRLGTILPFEPEWFGKRGIRTVHLGHPLMDDYGGLCFNELRRLREERLHDSAKPVTLGLLPGSRRQEIERLLPVMQVAAGIIQAWLGRRRLRILVSQAQGVDKQRLAAMVSSDAIIRDEALPNLLPELDLALVCSGTASLEASLAGVPHVVLYRTSRLNYHIARHLVKIPHIGLSNLILNRPLVPEHVQGATDPLFVAHSLLRYLSASGQRRDFYRGCEELRSLCGEEGAWRRAARAIDAMLTLAREA
jgi:lipid-A-disaccharide synthase